MHVFPSPHITKKVDLIILFETQITKNIEPHKGLIEDLYAVGNSVQIETSYGGYLDKEKFFNDEELIGCRIDQIEFDAKKKLSDDLIWQKCWREHIVETNFYFSNSSIKIYDNPNDWDIVIITGLQKDFTFLKESLKKDERKRPANFHLRSTDFQNVLEYWDGVAPVDVFNHMKKNVLNYYASKIV